MKSFDSSWERYSRVGFTSSSFRHSSVIFCMWAPLLNSCSQWRGKIDILQVRFLWPVLDVYLRMGWNSMPEAPFFALKWISKDKMRHKVVLCRYLKIGEINLVETHKTCSLQSSATEMRWIMSFKIFTLIWSEIPSRKMVWAWKNRAWLLCWCWAVIFQAGVM